MYVMCFTVVVKTKQYLGKDPGFYEGGSPTLVGQDTTLLHFVENHLKSKKSLERWALERGHTRGVSTMCTVPSYFFLKRIQLDEIRKV